MILTRAQRNRVKTALDQEQARYKEVLTIDAAQGQEASMVFLLLTKPSENPYDDGRSSKFSKKRIAHSAGTST